ncbi:hypothetical protein E2C01_026020 [Portunus trituberculatus]|uniref:Uncharacterized protein n=1 Tax=Portunus trituberculatus TaxID=210409 RepID=A0A5B7EH25_PORTR|nr:hypothetical protein [Portunus trituberculatus]
MEGAAIPQHTLSQHDLWEAETMKTHFPFTPKASSLVNTPSDKTTHSIAQHNTARNKPETVTKPSNTNLHLESSIE